MIGFWLKSQGNRTVIFYRLAGIKGPRAWKTKLRKDKEVNKYESTLDKVFDTQKLQALLVMKFHFIEAKKISYMKEGRKQTREETVSSYNRYRERKSTKNLSKSKWMEHWTLSSYKLYDLIDFEKFNW